MAEKRRLPVPFGIGMAVAFVLAPVIAGAAEARPSGPVDGLRPTAGDHGPQSGGRPGAHGASVGGRPSVPDVESAARVSVEIGALDADAAARLAARLPSWEEPINAGATHLTLPEALAEALVAEGVPIDITGDAPDAPMAWPACIPTLDQTLTWLDVFAAAHDDLVEVIDIGDSLCKIEGGCETPRRDPIPGDDLYVVRITRKDSLAEKDGRLFIDGGLHARELATVTLMQAVIQRLVEGYGTNPQITWLLDHREIYVGIASNPDGRRLVEMGTEAPYGGGPWYWRKNARQGARACAWPPTIANHFGVDLNRNHAFKWNAPGHSLDPCDQTYRGGSPASEPEIEAYGNFVRSIIEDQRGEADTDIAPIETRGMLINYHSYTPTGTVLVPWGWTTRKSPNDEGLVAIAQRYTALNGYGWSYSLYPVSGNTRDWGYGELGIPAYVVELRGRDFVPTCAEVDRVIEDNVPAVLLALGISDRPYDRIRGPEVVAIIPPAPVEAGSPLRIEARLDARRVRSTIHGAEVLVGRAGGTGDAGGGPSPWPLPAPDAPRGSGIPMLPVDGAFDLAIESGEVEVDTAGLEAGEYYAIVRAVDPVGHWGPERAIFFTVLPGSDPTASATPTPSPTASPSPSGSPEPSPSGTPSGTPTAGTPGTPEPTPTPADVPSATAAPPCTCELFLPWGRVDR